MTALALLVICLGLLMLAGRGLASGAQGDLLGVRFGGDGQRTRVVIDLERATQGRVIEDGTQGQVILSLLEVAAAAFGGPAEPDEEPSHDAASRRT